MRIEALNIGRVVALDVGTKTVGVAVCDPGRVVVRGVTTLARSGMKADIPRLVAILASLDVTEVVVGLPLELDGTESRSARLARQVGEALGAEVRLPVHYCDERYSSVQAERRLLAQGLSRERRREVIDQEAAAVILESWLRETADSAVQSPATRR